MSKRIASIAAALIVSAAASVTSALAQDARTFAETGLQVSQPHASRSFFGTPAWVDELRGRNAAAESVTTGSTMPRAHTSAYRYAGPHAGGPANDLPRR